MSTSETFLSASIALGLMLLCVSLLIVAWRVLRGPTLPDRVLGLDMLVAIAIGFLAIFGIKTGYPLYMDIAISLGLVGFLATAAFARFILSRARRPGGPESEERS